MFFDLSSSSSSLTITIKRSRINTIFVSQGYLVSSLRWVGRCWYGFVTDIMMSGRSYLARVIATIRLWLLLMFVRTKLDLMWRLKVWHKKIQDDKKVNGIQELSRATNARLDDWCFLTRSHCRLLHVCKTSHKIVDCWFYNTRHTPQAFFHTHASIKFNIYWLIIAYWNCSLMRMNAMWMHVLSRYCFCIILFFIASSAKTTAELEG